MRSRQDDPAEQLLDVLVYAPLGLLFEARELLPKLARKGRERMGGQVTVARMVGEMAVRQGQRRAEKVLERLRQQNSARAGAGAASGRASGTAGAGEAQWDAPGPGNGHGPTATSTPASAASPGAGPAATGGGAAPGTPVSSSLAIPGYDTLSASQVVPRLEGLSAEELEAVRRYEEATRARKTVLTRIDQLRGRS